MVLACLGCRTWARVEENLTWNLLVPEKVSRGADLVFTAEARNEKGEAVRGISFLWAVDWVGSHGSKHKGVTFEPQDLRSKGGVGEGLLRIYAYDIAGNVVQVAQKGFRVE